MKAVLTAIARTPVLGRSLLALYRAKVALPYVARPVGQMLGWLVRSKEVTNFTYRLDEQNRQNLAALIAHVTRRDYPTILGYIAEIEGDAALAAHIAGATARSGWSFAADAEARFGRRAGWYALVRAIKPGLVVETGVDKGIGACSIAAALKRNREEGSGGRYLGTDINPKAGYLLSGPYAEFGKVVYGDSIESLKQLAGPIDLFINDSEHSADYEAAEYEVIAAKMAAGGIILGDNAHCTDKLLRFSLATGREFLFFQERPDRHWYPGGGIGISFLDRQRA